MRNELFWGGVKTQVYKSPNALAIACKSVIQHTKFCEVTCLCISYLTLKLKAGFSNTLANEQSSAKLLRSQPFLA